MVGQSSRAIAKALTDQGVELAARRRMVEQDRAAHDGSARVKGLKFASISSSHKGLLRQRLCVARFAHGIFPFALLRYFKERDYECEKNRIAVLGHFEFVILIVDDLRVQRRLEGLS